jgi:hypothetical protein
MLSVVPYPGVLGHPGTACRGQAAIGRPAKYVLVLFTNVATVRMSRNRYGGAGCANVTSVHTPLEIIETRPMYWREEENVVREPTKEERARRHVDTFLAEVYSLAGIGDTDAAGDKVFDFLDRLLCDGFFTVCDEILGRVEVKRLPPTLMRSFLSITAPARHKLPSRKTLYKQIEKRMIELRGPEKTRRIIGNLA